MTCQDLVHAIDPYLDDELSILEVLRVQGHLRGCDRCRARVDAEAALHALLAADAIQDQPRPTLRDRILQRIAEAPAGPSRSGSPRLRVASTSVLVTGVALIGLLLVALVIPGLRGPGDVPPFAAEVAAKHRLYTEGGEPSLDVTTADIRQLTGWLASRVGFPINAPRRLEPGQHVVGGRVSSVADAPAAYLLYEWGGRPLSLFVMAPPPGIRAGGAERVVDGVELYTARVSGMTVVWWEDAERLYVAASTGSPTDLEAFAVLCVQSGARGGPSDPAAEARHG